MISTSIEAGMPITTAPSPPTFSPNPPNLPSAFGRVRLSAFLVATLLRDDHRVRPGEQQPGPPVGEPHQVWRLASHSVDLDDFAGLVLMPDGVAVNANLVTDRRFHDRLLVDGVPLPRRALLSLPPRDPPTLRPVTCLASGPDNGVDRADGRSRDRPRIEDGARPIRKTPASPSPRTGRTA